MKKPYQIVFTTINHPVILEELYENISKFGHLDKTKIWVIGDYKTPASAAALAKQITDKGLESVYLDIAAQDAWGKSLEFYKIIPYNSDARRLVGYLKAWQDGCEIMISIDDDNFPTAEDFVGGHIKATGQPAANPILSEDSGFHNVCEYLQFQPSREIFPRGFPFELRGNKNNPKSQTAPGGAIIGVTEGLWLKEPDIDATTWLNGKVSAIDYNGPELLVLEQKTWSPINTQNTSVVRELIPAYFYAPMSWPVPGGKIDRYGDIWGGYFLQSLMQGTRYHTAFGRPLVEHRRNPHSYIDDLRFEFWGMVLTDWLLQSLRDKFRPKSAVMTERLLELGDFLLGQIDTMPAWCPPEMKGFITYTSANLKLWSQAFKILKA